MVNTIYSFSFVETPRIIIVAIINLRGVSTKLNKYRSRKFVIAKLLICKLRSFISGSALMKIRVADRKLCNNKFTSCYHKLN